MRPMTKHEHLARPPGSQTIVRGLDDAPPIPFTRRLEGVPDFRLARPQLGDAVRYVMPAGSHWAGEERHAIVVSPHPGERYACNLCVFLSNPGDFFGVPEYGRLSSAIDPTSLLLGGVELDPNGGPGTWHWPGSLEGWVAPVPNNGAE